MVGTALCAELNQHNLLIPRKHELNVTNQEQIKRFRVSGIDLIIHLACETDHEYCEINPTQCYFVNTVGTGFMTNLAWELSIPIIYMSTASIFDGMKGTPYLPVDRPNPINHYNTSKYYGELVVRGYERHIILRSGWMFGGGADIDKKFVGKLVKKIEAGEKQIKVCDDCIGSPTYSVDLADAMKYVIDNLVDGADWGTYNCVNKGGGVSRYEFAAEIIKHLKTDAAVIHCKIDDLKSEFPCKRTNYEVLADGIEMPDWKDSLKGYILANY